MRERHASQEARHDPVIVGAGTSSTDLPNAPQPCNDDPRRLVRISARAHELYEARGAGDGADLDDWLQAEREIDATDES